MNISFNPDGSIRMPMALQQARDQHENKMRTGRCVMVRKEVMRTSAPKLCYLHLTMSEPMRGDLLIERLHAAFRAGTSETPTKLRKINDREYVLEVGTAFRRCSDCGSFIGKLREALDGNVVLDRGNCTYEPRSFSFDDHFE